MAVKNTNSERVRKGKQNRRGIHAKTKNSKMKASKNYKKSYRGQGR
ncbi:MAG: hypothetical protein ACXAAH_11475 [Promethearchaeota archaeon]|jgi:hypothetical protein